MQKAGFDPIDLGKLDTAGRWRRCRSDRWPGRAS